MVSAAIGPLVLFATQFFMYLALSLTLNLEFGITGIPNFGKVLFVAAGGMLGASATYRLALFAFNLRSNDIFESSPLFVASKINPGLANNPFLAAELFVFAVVFGALVAGALGYLSSYPAIRLREDYLGMLLLGAGELFAVLTAFYPPIVGGPENLTSPDLLTGFGNNESLAMMVILGVFALGVFLYAQRVAKSPLGRTLRAVRENEVASEALGKDNINIRRKMLVISSALAGAIGALWTIYWAQIGGLIGGDVGSTFPRLFFTFYPFVIVILGGAANNYGVLVGSFLLTGLQTITTESLPALVTNVKIPGFGVNLLDDVLNSTQYIIVGLLLLVVVLWRPEGLLREKPSYAIPKSKLKAMASKILGDSDSKKKSPGSG
ncbi:MAG TPA: branched-chain amino acid ABC transporter permease [Nitrososphaerales archaeon]|nr:branched-chain amino acid ABC transporter permease [Nitrososphaerales archaeon]